MANKRTHLHFVGIGGYGMSGIAQMALELGYEVSGSDICRSSRIKRLEKLGALIYLEHKAENVLGADKVIVSSAIAKNNVEIVSSLANNIPVIERAEMLAELMKRGKSIAVAGTHGKTTTTSMVAKVFESAGLDPTSVIGGESNDDGANARLGSGEHIIVEADESDKSFLILDPEYAIVTNIEEEHLDCYGSLEAILEAFTKFLSGVSGKGFAVVCNDDPNIRKILPDITGRFVTYGFTDSADYTARNAVMTAKSSRYDIFWGEKKLGGIELQVLGRHNILNSLACAVMGLELGLKMDSIRAGLKKFTGVQRRFQLIGEENGIMVIDDYGHHPTEVRSVLETAKLLNRKKITVIFQPHRYSRVKFLGNMFGRAFECADKIYVTDIYSAGEEPISSISSLNVIEAVQKATGVLPMYVKDRNRISDLVLSQATRGEVILTVGAGDITDIAYEIMDKLKSGGPC